GVIGKAVQEGSNVLVQLEAAIDFPTEELDADASNTLTEKLQDAFSSLSDLLSQARIRVNQLEGLRTPICGKRNVGKSSLLNRLLGRDRALVTPYPGTTRDTVEEDTVLEGVLLHLSDTAGIGETEDPVELLGLQRTNEAIQDADIILFIVDISEPISREDHQVFALIKEHFPKHLDERVLLLANKVDRLRDSDTRDAVLDSLRREFEPLSPLSISALTGEGINTLCQRLAGIAHHEQSEVERSAAGARVRQRILLHEAVEAITRAIPLTHPPQDNPELAVIEIRTALNALEQLDGVNVCPDVLESIFSRFCIGK
ncbi:MAG TPA: 50S ribosome-binding GTPase, partial [bacterium]|nr:50S ribosome-binding GTPase [bacterium]